MADVKWSNDTAFVPQSGMLDTDYVMGLNTAVENVKYTRNDFLLGDGDDFSWDSASFTLLAGDNAHITGGNNNILFGKGATTNHDGVFICTGDDSSSVGDRFSTADNQALFWKIGGFGLNTNSSGGLEGPQASFHSAKNYGAVGDFLFSAAAEVANANMVAYEVNPHISTDVLTFKYKSSVGGVANVIFPSGGGNIASLASNNTWTGTQNFQANVTTNNLIITGYQTNVLDVGSPVIPSTISANILTNGIVTLNPVSSGQTMTFDTSANIYSELGSPPINSTFNLTIVNTSLIYAITLAPAADMLFNGMPSLVMQPGQTFNIQGIFTAIAPPLCIFYGGTNTTVIPVITETGTSRTLSAVDINSYIRTTNGSTVTITVPNGVYAQGQQTYFYTGGAGQISFVASGTTINSKFSQLKTLTQGSPACLTCINGGLTFDLVGDLSA